MFAWRCSSRCSEVLRWKAEGPNSVLIDQDLQDQAPCCYVKVLRRVAIGMDLWVWFGLDWSGLVLFSLVWSMLVMVVSDWLVSSGWLVAPLVTAVSLVVMVMLCLRCRAKRPLDTAHPSPHLPPFEVLPVATGDDPESVDSGSATDGEADYVNWTKENQDLSQEDAGTDTDDDDDEANYVNQPVIDIQHII
ncbi:unnamed protein product [Merluccius merluccius]